jgi:DNA-binding NtrC family response regulator
MFIQLQDTDNTDAVWKIDGRPLVVGRGRGCDIRIEDPELSRRHVKVWLEDGAVRFQDLGSRNATLVNGAPAHNGFLRPGDILGASSVSFKIIENWRVRDSLAASSTPSTLTCKLGAYLGGEDFVNNAFLTHRTVHELHDLFSFGRLLGSVVTIRDLTDLLVDTLREKFDPVSVCIAWRFGEGTPLVVDDSVDANPPDHRVKALLEVALQSNEALLKPSVLRIGRERINQTTMAVPLVHAERSLGGFVLVGSHPRRLYAEDDLHFALSLAAITAPHVRAVRHVEQLRRDNEALTARVGASSMLLGESASIREVRELLARAAGGRQPVLILGETGTGKEIAARMIHESSPRAEGPYVTVNCAAIPAQLFESEFFGHERGAFTGATESRTGRFAEAHGGTLFLDEIGDLSRDNQARILRAIESNTFHRVGGGKPVHVDVRIVAATNKALVEPEFRNDLYHRLNGVKVVMPPLRERKVDIPILARHFLHTSPNRVAEGQCRIGEATLERLTGYHWPGNVRELKSAIDRMILFARGDELLPGGFDEPLESVQNGDIASVQNGDSVDDIDIPTLAELERIHVEKVVAHCRGNVARAARILGINRATLYKRLAEYRIY